MQDALVSAMNSIVDLTKDVESKEKAAEEVKEEANRSCSDIFAKVDELKQALRRAKEANDMVVSLVLVNCFTLIITCVCIYVFFFFFWVSMLEKYMQRRLSLLLS